MDFEESTKIANGSIIFVSVLLILFTSLSTNLNVAESSSGLTKLGNLGDRISGLDFNSGVFFGNVESCSDATTCIGTNNDDIIYGGVREQVFGLKGEDMILGSLDSQLY